MAFSRTEPRHHITYLRRRPKPGEPSSGPARGSVSLQLAGPGTVPSLELPPVPRLRGRTILDDRNPAVTLDRRQSAIGSLVFTLVGGGEAGCVWELADGESGVVSRATRTLVAPEFGRRSIVGIEGERLIAGLRHVRQLRRLLILADGLTNRRSRLVGELHGGGVVEMVAQSAAGSLVCLAIYQVDGELVIRRENTPFANAAAAADAYGFAASWLPPVR